MYCYKNRNRSGNIIEAAFYTAILAILSLPAVCQSALGRDTINQPTQLEGEVFLIIVHTGFIVTWLIACTPIIILKNWKLNWERLHNAESSYRFKSDKAARVFKCVLFGVSSICVICLVTLLVWALLNSHNDPTTRDHSTAHELGLWIMYIWFFVFVGTILTIISAEYLTAHVCISKNKVYIESVARVRVPVISKEQISSVVIYPSYRNVSGIKKIVVKGLYWYIRIVIPGKCHDIERIVQDICDLVPNKIEHGTG